LKVDSLTVAGTAITAVFVAVIFIMVGKAFPLQAFGSPLHVVGPSALGQEIGSYLWGTRSLDLIVVAFVLFFSALGCIAVLREERGDL